MIQAWFVTVLPVMFLVVLFGGEGAFKKRNIDMGGEPPINRAVFLASKFVIVLLWAAMVGHCWDINLSFFAPPGFARPAALALWAAGFSLLLAGRFTMGSSFRIGSPRESTGLKVGGLFRFSRNPMYLGVFSTLAAAVLCTFNPLVLLLATFIAAAHHRIVLAEEEYLKKAFGQEYLAYCARVRRYI